MACLVLIVHLTSLVALLDELLSLVQIINYVRVGDEFNINFHLIIAGLMSNCEEISSIIIGLV